ncbi:MAG TPA: hypothetical protein VGN51_01090 [Acidimicrobiia bacterium]|jgi:hypothetical protein
MTASGYDLLEWISNAETGGQLSQNTARQYASCVRGVLDAQPLGFDDELRESELDLFTERFRTKNSDGGRRQPQTVETYVSSFKAAARGFFSDRRHAGIEDESGPEEVEAAEREARVRRWDFPLRADFNLAIELPVDLRPVEAERLCLFVRSLAVAPEPTSDAELVSA